MPVPDPEQFISDLRQLVHNQLDAALDRHREAINRDLTDGRDPQSHIDHAMRQSAQILQALGVPSIRPHSTPEDPVP